VLEKLGILSFFSLILSNEDVTSSKPHPEIYWKTMMHFQAVPDATVIFEDSYVGRLAAQRSGARLIPIENRQDLTWQKIRQVGSDSSTLLPVKTPWKSDKLNVLIPMAGAGSRFEAAGFTFPKPLIEVRGKPMIQVVVENLNIDARYIYIVQKSHFEKYNLDYLLKIITPNCEIVQIEGLTEGAACTTLLARDYIDSEESLIIANSDQFVEWNSGETIYSFMADGIDGGIVTFKATHPKWSYARIDENGIVEEVAEKKPISDIATVGIYFWRRGSDYVKYANTMIEKNIRTNGEFYVCPVFNQAIEDGKKFRIRNIEQMWGLGTPEDLSFFLENQK
jgi:dTDP-glucose pyrophosphorylase